ncbi:DUF6221 family protein [Streptomyces anthocyanicus]|uniref:DUF6221 family protein n=1 Tax=Streptomyces anthocyanicus TaxID=68174 RepID=UPI0037F912DE
MDDLAAWLRAQLDEDERTARASVWDGLGNKLAWELAASATIDVGGDEFYAGDRTIANHVVAWDPARVLREIDAKRQTLADLATAEERMDRASRDQDTAGYNASRAEATVLKRIARRDAAVYADRPGYREEWRP